MEAPPAPRQSSRRRRRHRRGGTVFAVLIAISFSAGSPGTAAHGAPGPAVAQTADLPTIGDDVVPAVRTCAQPAPGRLIPRTIAECARWSTVGPVNVVVAVAPGRDFYRMLLERSRPLWRPAGGNWLVASGSATGAEDACGPSWQGSRDQAELRLSPVTRRHVKLIRVGCSASGWTYLVAEAHTDRYDRARCGGDFMTDLDRARDALVNSVAGLAGTTMAYGPADLPHAYPGGCGAPVPTDGRVASITLGAISP